MSLINPIFIILISVCPILIIIGYIMLKMPPKSSNMLYGYRTKQSRSSIDKWNFSQPYSAIQLLKSGVIGMLISLGTLFIEVEENFGVAVGLFLVFILVAYPFYKTEKALKQKFGK